MSNEITLRSPTAEEFGRFLAPLSIAFSEEFSDAAIESERHTVELDRFIGALDGETVVGCAAAYSFRLTVPGGEVGAAGITSVGVLPSHRRRGIMRQMMIWLFAQARERQDPVAILWASEAAIYQRFGFGPGTLQTQVDAVKDKIRFSRPVETAGRVRILGIDEAAERFPPIYEAIRRSTPGAVTRTAARWRWELLADTEWHRHGNGPKVLALLETEDRARGYVIYRARSDWDAFGPKGVVTVLEVSALDPIAEQALWEWIFGIDLISSVRCWRGPAPHPLQLMVTEPRRLGTTYADGTWLRIIDLPAALESRTYRGSADLVLDVGDAFCPWNAGRWRLSVPGEDSGDRASVIPAGTSAGLDLALDISDLAAVYLGAFRFVELVDAGRVRECRPGAAAAADMLFATVRAPSASTAF
jgi:predicted acetyltransferase